MWLRHNQITYHYACTAQNWEEGGSCTMHQGALHFATTNHEPTLIHEILVCLFELKHIMCSDILTSVFSSILWGMGPGTFRATPVTKNHRVNLETHNSWFDHLPLLLLLLLFVFAFFKVRSNRADDSPSSRTVNMIYISQTVTNWN